MFTRVAAIVAFIGPGIASAQVYDDLKKAWAWEQGVRNECRAALTAPAPDPQAVRDAIFRLRGLLEYFNDPRTIAMSGRNDFLQQPDDIYGDLAQAHAVIGEHAEAAKCLDALWARLDRKKAPVGLYVFHANRFDRLAPVAARADARVTAAFARLTASDPYRMFRARAIGTPFDESLSEDLRVAGLSLLWSEAKYNFANFDRVPELDWDRAYLAALPRVRTAADTLGYYRVLQQFCASLRDSHTDVSLPAPLRERYEAQPPILTTLAENRVFISRLHSAKLAALGLAPGQEVVRIEGSAVREYAERMFGPYVCASTPQDREVRLFIYQLFKGPADRPVRLAVVDTNGATKEIAVPRTGYDDVTPDLQYEFSLLAGKIALVTLRNFESRELVDCFVTDLPAMQAADGLVIDIRENGGGSSDVGYSIFSHLTEKPFLGSAWRTPEYRPAFRAWNQPVSPYVASAQSVDGKGSFLGDKPVALLIGPRTFSAAEDFAVAFDAARRGPLVGEATGGSTGQPLFLNLPGGGSARICTKRDTYPDGKEFVGVGVQPTIAVAPKGEDVRQGQDTVLNRAVELIKQGAAGKR